MTEFWNRCRVALLPSILWTATACHAAPRAVAPGDAASPLRLDQVIALPDVAGRIDHLAVDLKHHLLFVAEYANGSVDSVDLASGKIAGRISGLSEPQGIAVLSDGEQVVVACGDGSVRFYATSDRREIARIALGDDADNVRIDERNGHVIVGYGAGGLAVIDPVTHEVLSRLPLPGHPEGFRLVGDNALINIPDRGAIVSGNLDLSRVTAIWSTGIHRLNFPLAVDTTGKWFALAYRFPAVLQLRSVDSGAIKSTQAACGDADDLFIDQGSIYMVCGAGHVDVISASGDIRRVQTANGARTGLYVAELGTLFVAVPARGHPAAIWALKLNRPKTAH